MQYTTGAYESEFNLHLIGCLFSDYWPTSERDRMQKRVRAKVRP